MKPPEFQFFYFPRRYSAKHYYVPITRKKVRLPSPSVKDLGPGCACFKLYPRWSLSPISEQCRYYFLIGHRLVDTS